MPEVIDLLSSSPPPNSGNQIQHPQLPNSYNHSFAQRNPLGVTEFSPFGDEDHEGKELGSRAFRGELLATQQSGTQMTLVSEVGTSDFEDSRIFDDSVLGYLRTDEFPGDQPTKRQKMTPTESKPLPQIKQASAVVDTVYELSSEPDILAPPSDYVALSEPDENMVDFNDRDADIFRFSSSAPALGTSANKTHHDVVELSSDDAQSFVDQIIASSQPMRVTKSRVLSERTTNVLANLKSSRGRSSAGKKFAANALPSSRPPDPCPTTTSMQVGLKQITKDVEDIIDSSQSVEMSTSPAKRGNRSVIEGKRTNLKRRTEGERERERNEKEAGKELKRLQKEQKAKDKQLAADKAEVNKKKTDKKKSSQEMIINLPNSIKDKALGNQVEELMKEVDVETRYYQTQLDITRSDMPTNHGNIIKWHRKVNSRYNEDTEEYESCPPKIEEEKHILIHLPAEEFCAIAAADLDREAADDNNNDHPSEDTMKQNLNNYVASLRNDHSGVTIIFLIQGLTAFLKKSAGARNREYAAAVRAQNPGSDPQASTATVSSSAPNRASKKRKPKTHQQLDLSFLTADHLEALTLHLQLNHQPLHIHHTTTAPSSAHQISAFTQHLSTRPYRLNEQRHNLAHASFCMASGQFKTGQGDPTETFTRMLEQVNRITPSMATGIIAQGHATPAQLVAAFRLVRERASVGGEGEREAKERAKLMLQDVKKAMNRNGGYSDKRLGPAASKRLYKVFMSRDENLRDGIV